MKRGLNIIIYMLCFILGWVLSSKHSLKDEIILHPKDGGIVEISSSPSPAFVDEFGDPIIDQSEFLVDISAKYFDPDEVFQFDSEKTVLFGGDLEITNLPVPIESDGVEVLNKKLKVDSFDGDIESGEKIDVDGDGLLEEIFYASVAMTHKPHIAMIVKNNKIIYESDALARAHISGSKSKNGFYISEQFNIGDYPVVGGHRKTRVIFEDGKFIPVWYRERFQLQTTKP